MIVRREIVGHEGGECPILIEWERDGEFWGLYSRLTLMERPMYHGPMFEEAK